jgi:hypothetical protein
MTLAIAPAMKGFGDHAGDEPKQKPLNFSRKIKGLQDVTERQETGLHIIDHDLTKT